jgi:hypothetical protein
MKNKDEAAKTAQNESIEIRDDAEKNTPILTKNDMNAKFNKLVLNLINLYEKYCQQNSQNLMGEDDKENQQQQHQHNTSLTSSKKTLFEQFINLFEKMCCFILSTKRENFNLFMSLFQKTNLITIQFYEFINKLLNSTHESHNSLGNSSCSTDCNSVIVSRTLELLNILTSSKMKNSLLNLIK